MSGDRDQWKKIQERTFTNWFNDRLRGHLKVSKKQIQSLETDLVDGLMLIELLEKLASPKTVGRYSKNPKQKLQMIENLGTALQFIYNQKIKLVNIGPEDIHNGNLKLILGLIWTLIKAYQIKFTGKGISTKAAMLSWVTSIIPGYAVTNFTTQWNDGRCLCGVVDKIRPGACPNHQALDPVNGLENCRLGMDLAENLLGIPKVMDPEDLNNPSVDELSVMTYVSYFCNPANALIIDWIRKKIPENNITNLSTDWNNGVNLGALGEACFPGLCPDWRKMDPTDAIKNNERLLGLMKDRLGLVCPVSPAELADPKVDELLVATYLSQFRNAKLKASPEEFGLKVPSLPSGSALVKEPVTFEVEFSDQTANMMDDIRVTAHGPSADVKVSLRPKDKNCLEAVFAPTEAGSYDVMAIYNDENIAGSPFALPVADPSKCAIFGDIPNHMQVGKEEGLVVKAREAGVASLSCTMDNYGDETSAPPLTSEVTEQENQQFEVALTPKEIGHAIVHLKWANVEIPQSPFKINVCDASKASITGIANEGKVGEPVTFQVRAKEAECGKGLLKVSPRGPSANYNPVVKKVGDDADGVYDVSFVPWEIGPHKVDVEYGEEGVVPQSPFSMNIIAAPNANTCSVSGKGLKKAVVGEKTTFQILSPESALLTKKDPPGLAVKISSPTDKAAADITDNNDGSYTVNYTASTPGDYDIAVKFYDNHIPGSPFKLDVVPSADASKCKAYGPALHPNSLHIAGNPLDMFVDTTEAGTGDLRIIVAGPNDSRPKVYIANEKGVYSIKWDVPDPGRYQVHIWWADQYIPGSPFKIKVSPGPNAGMVRAYGPGLEPDFEILTHSSEFTIETKDAGIGTLTVRVHGVKGAFKIQAQPVSEDNPRTLKASYHPQQGGDYIIAIRWSGTHIPGSPFKISIREPPKNEESKTKPQAPKIYLSHQGESVEQPQNGVGENNTKDDESTPEPTPLSEVKTKKSGSKKDKKAEKNGMKAHSNVELIKKNPMAASSSTPAIQQQMVVSGAANGGVVRGGAAGGGGVMFSGIQKQQIHYKQTITTTSSSSSSSKVSSSSSEKAKKKKKKF